jgi:hypothetical protein
MVSVIGELAYLSMFAKSLFNLLYPEAKYASKAADGKFCRLGTR